jgi:hypothetical protein
MATFFQGPIYVLKHDFAAGGGGVADDVILFDGDAPWKFRVIEAILLVSTSVAASTAVFRDTKDGLGNTLSDSLVTSANGRKRSTDIEITAEIPKDGTFVLRRSDNGIAGSIIIQAYHIK